MDANDAALNERQPTNETKLNTILIEIFGAVPIDGVLSKPGMTVRLEVEE